MTVAGEQLEAGFNPRPRVGGDHNLVAKVDPESVSIHAPAWGATAEISFGR